MPNSTEGPSIVIRPPQQGTTPHDDRDADCGEMIDPIMDEILAASVKVGWHYGEIIAAVLDWTVMTARDQAGDSDVRALLAQASELLDNRKN